MSRLVRVPQRANENSALAGLEDVLGPGLGGSEAWRKAPSLWGSCSRRSSFGMCAKRATPGFRTPSFRLSPFHSEPMCSAPWLSMVFGMGISPPSYWQPSPS